LLAETILERHPLCSLTGLDGSQEMLEKARTRLARFGGRFTAEPFDLGSDDWRGPRAGVRAVVTSLTVHHLEGLEKLRLFQDVCRMLEPGGIYVMADIILAAHETGRLLAAEAWDEAVRRRSLALEGSPSAFDAFVALGWNMHRHLDPDDIDKPSTLLEQLKWMEAAGFVDVDVHWMRAGHVIVSGRRP
jgi:tRNA (cmo5U34)-methyltransferase